MPPPCACELLLGFAVNQLIDRFDCVAGQMPRVRGNNGAVERAKARRVRSKRFLPQPTRLHFAL